MIYKKEVNNIYIIFSYERIGKKIRYDFIGYIHKIQYIKRLFQLDFKNKLINKKIYIKNIKDLLPIEINTMPKCQKILQEGSFK